MTHISPADRPAVVARAAVAGYVDWPAIFAGTALAVALSFVLLTFGSAIGLSATSFEPGEGVSLRWVAIASGIWFLWVAITAFAAGGYLAGRLRRPVADATSDEVEARDGAHGLVVWAVGAIAGAILAASGITGVVGAAGSVAGTAAQTAAEAVGGDVSYLGSRLLRGDGGDAAAVLTRNLADGDMSAEDRDYLVSLVAERTGQTPEEAGAAVDTAVTEAKAFYADALQTAEQARVAGAIAAFVIAATLMASAAAAWLAAAAGGDHRDRSVPFGTFDRRR
ncbi:MAG TPA: hypothetical protein VFN28_03675 [Amaricoccus sp.]|nr:hypothetical protein [Amaricoccus sp.]